MIDLFKLIVGVLASLFKSRAGPDPAGGSPCSLLDFENGEALPPSLAACFSCQFRDEAAPIIQRSANRPRDFLGFLTALVRIAL
jgi:hypothetical protein